jgi:hypothetical protein
MTTQEHNRLLETIASAQNIARSRGLRMAVIESLYVEIDYERFQYVPVAGVSTLHPSGQAALIGIAYPSGLYRNAAEIADLLEASGI